MSKEQLMEANEVLGTVMPWILAISAGIVLYNFLKAWVYHRQAKQWKS